jgi:Protein of unknown function (DUF4065)
LKEGKMRATVRYDRQRFRELLVYVAERTGDDRRFGDVKVNKVLWFADFRAYNEHGSPITGARYQKLKLGPAAVAFKPVRDELVGEGALTVGSRVVGTKRQTVTRAKRPADTSLFSVEQLQLVDEIIEWLGPKSANDVSDLSHEKSAGWHMVELRDTIPYGTALLSTDPPSDRTITRARELAARFGW